MEKSKFAYITAGVAGVVVLAIICVLFVWMICVRANKKKQQEQPVQKAMTIPPDAASQVSDASDICDRSYKLWFRAEPVSDAGGAVPSCAEFGSTLTRMSRVGV